MLVLQAPFQGVTLGAAAAAADMFGTGIRVVGAIQVGVATGDYRPLLDAAVGIATGRLAPLAAQPFADALVKLGFDKAFGEDMPMCTARGM